MADAKKCDRCGAYYMAGKGRYGKKRIRVPGNTDSYYDLCENCQDDLDKFMDSLCNDTACEKERVNNEIQQ